MAVTPGTDCNRLAPRPFAGLFCAVFLIACAPVGATPGGQSTPRTHVPEPAMSFANKPSESRPASETRVTLTGNLVPGVTCPAVRLEDGRTVALSHLLPGFDTGMRVTVTGSGYGASMTCQQEVLLVTGMRAAP